MYKVKLVFEFEYASGLLSNAIVEHLGVFEQSYYLTAGNPLPVPVSIDFALRQFNTGEYFALKFEETVGINYRMLVALPKEAFVLSIEGVHAGNRTLSFNHEFWNEDTLEKYIPQFQKKVKLAEPKKWYQFWK